MAITASFDKELGLQESLTFCKNLALVHCHRAGIYGLPIRKLIIAEDWASLCALEVDYAALPDAFVAANIRQALGFFTKLETLDVGVDKVKVAKKSFYESEGICLRTNIILDMVSEGSFSFPKDVERVLKSAERKIDRVLGPVPNLEKLDYLFGPGATTSVRKINACSRTKLSSVPSCSRNMVPLLSRFLEEVPAYCSIHDSGTKEESFLVNVEIHNGRIAFVPKNAKTYRSVMTEPTLNALVQSAVGRFVTDRLLRVGLDLTDQSRNQRLAREGSLTGALATLDLSGASDSIASGLVARLLPYEWYALLSLCRTPVVDIDGKSLALHKFSSMGNGFTFPLQTLIFWALAKASSELSGADEPVCVYGDDIILGVKAVPTFRSVLLCTGFKLNTEKSFWSGPFRESCGKDYLKGIDIRPFYVKRQLTGEVLFSLHNFYYRNYDPLATLVEKALDPSLRIYGPDGYGDGTLLCNNPPLKPHKRGLGYGGYTFETYTTIPRYHVKVLPGDAVLPSYSSYVRSFAPSGVGGAANTRHSNESCDGADDGVPMIPLPGSEGVRRIKIYTLSP